MTQIPERFMVWHSMPNLSHIGTWATERYPEEAVEAVRADLIPAMLAEARAEGRREALREAAETARTQHHRWAETQGDADGAYPVECDASACENIATAILALLDTPAPARTGDLLEDAARHAAENPMPAPAQPSVQVIKRVIQAYDDANPIRTADQHFQNCACLRCDIDRMRAFASEDQT